MHVAADVRHYCTYIAVEQAMRRNSNCTVARSSPSCDARGPLFSRRTWRQVFWDLTAWGTKAHTEALVGSRIVRPEVSSLAMGYRDIARIARSKLQQSVDNRGTKCKETKRVNESPRSASVGQCSWRGCPDDWAWRLLYGRPPCRRVTIMTIGCLCKIIS